MATGNLPTFDLVASALRQLGATEGATEAHGSLCGLTCVLGSRARLQWVSGLTGEPVDAATGGDETVLAELAAVTATALAEGQMAFTPLLPPEDRPLAARTEALADWCAGFMHGLGEATAGAALGGALAAPVAREIMQDFAEIARVTLGEDETELEAEAAYAELVEFVRVSVQLLFEELHDVRHGVAAGGVH
jgi:hypothetical protein